MERLYSGYDFDDECRFVPRPDFAETINFDHLKELLLSTDEGRYQEIKRLTANNKCVFLDGTVPIMSGFEHVAFQSLVRSGNTFLRCYLERISGVYTGADMGIQMTVHEAMMGLLGQNITGESDRVWITKTHKPMDTPNSKGFHASKMIVIARNPIDVIPSFANLVNTNSHSLEPNEQYNVDFPEFWDQFVRNFIEKTKTNHEVVVNKMSRSIPTYFMRYEDLKANPRPSLEELFCFLLDVPSIENTNVQRRIQEVTKTGFSDKQAYKLKSTSTSLCRQRHMYTEAQLEYM